MTETCVPAHISMLEVSGDKNHPLCLLEKKADVQLWEQLGPLIFPSDETDECDGVRAAPLTDEQLL